MKKCSKILSFVLSLILFIGIFGVQEVNVSAESGVKSKLDAFMSSYPDGGRWTGTFAGGIQCFGFGKMAIYNIFGTTSSGSYRTWGYDGNSRVGMMLIGSTTNFSSSSVKNLLSAAKPGDILQFNTSRQHTMIVYSVESDGVWIYDCNWDNNCGIDLRKSSFGAWSSRNSTKLSLLRADNYDEIDGIHTHSYQGPYYEAIHPHRIYMKCACKEYYYTDEYQYLESCDACITHTCDKGKRAFSEAVHPHYTCYTCSLCKEVWRNYEEPNYRDDCIKCNTPEKPVLHTLKTEYAAHDIVRFSWDTTTNTTHYNLCLYKQNADGEWSVIERIFYAESGCERQLSVGEYKCVIQSYNSKYWREDGADWLYTESDEVRFTVKEHLYQGPYYEAIHPHRIYMKCACKEYYYTDEYQYLESCDACITHTCDKGKRAFSEAVHPHYTCYTCSLCKEVWRNYEEPNYRDDCIKCNTPEKPVLSSLQSQYATNETITFSWNATVNTTHYNLYLYKLNKQNEWEVYEHTFYIESGFERQLPVGDYKCVIQSYNSNYWREDGVDWLYVEGDPAYFSIIGTNAVYGDINGDNKMDLSDATLLFYYVNGLVEFSGEQLNCSDVNSDDRVDLNDATQMFYRVNGLIG